MKKKASQLSSLLYYRRFFLPILVCLAIALYANTLGHEFTQDDAIVIYKNNFTQKGISGISDIVSTDTFHGFFGSDKSTLVSGGRYRPLTLIYFATLWEIVGNHPLIYHISNVAMYGLLIWILFQYLSLLRPYKKDSHNILWVFICGLIFTVHPIHTEVVANVKGLDEIWSLLFGLIAAICALRYIDTKKTYLLLVSSICVILGTLSKENAIAFVGIIPLSILFFRKASFKSFLPIAGSLVAALVIYMAIRISVVGLSMGQPPLEMMNNPFIKVVGGVYYPFTAIEKWASIIYGLGKYVLLLFFPHPLTHDYYPRHFEVFTFGSPEVIFALIMNVMIAAFAIVDFRKKRITSFTALFYMGSIALTSNVIFPIGTHLSERFLFMPSVAFAMLISSFFIAGFKRFNSNLIHVVLGVIILLFSSKTIMRNNTWKSDYRLFTTDVHNSPNSAKVQNAAGGSMLTRASKITDENEQNLLRTQALVHLKNAIAIHPQYKNAHLLKGNAHFGLNQYSEAISAYEYALQIDPSYQSASDNIILAYREGARFEGSQRGNINKAIQYLYKADVLQPGNYETISLLGIAHGNSGQHQKALEFFQKALQIQPNNAQAHLNLANVYMNTGNTDREVYHKQQAANLRNQ